MHVEMRYATASDFAALHGDRKLPFTRHGFALVIDGKPLALACLYYNRSRHLIASVDMDKSARAYPVTLHKWAKKAIWVAKNIGAQSFLVIADETVPRSAAWVERLGLKSVGEAESGRIYEWRSS